ncbi:hypothetical protein P20652_2151 [Pseudoalteromonas sp. BSi20652]|nr:hypothetical protein P20652_2151 [Pseudoalteromonas sp. BSi20652]
MIALFFTLMANIHVRISKNRVKLPRPAHPFTYIHVVDNKE